LKSGEAESFIIIKMIKGIAFDLEGTVIDLETFHHQAHLEVFKKVGLDISVEEAIKKIDHFIGGPDKEIMEDVHKIGYNCMNVDEMLKLDKNFYISQLEKAQIFPRKGFLEFLTLIRGLGLSYSIGSLTQTKEAIFILEKSGLYNFFPKERIVLREDVKNAKPFPDVYLETAKRMGIKPEEQLVFEDSHNGVGAAISAGSKAVGMPVYDIPFVLERLKNSGAYPIFLSWEKIDPVKLLNSLE